MGCFWGEVMKIIDAETEMKDFLQFVATKKKELSAWQFLHVAVDDPEKKIRIEDVGQFLTAYIQSKHAQALKLPDGNSFLVFAHKDDSLMLGTFEKSIYESFSKGAIQIQSRGMDADGLEQFSTIIEPYIDQDDVMSRVIFTRMRRLGNSILVLDDDLIILKQMDKILSGFGRVVTIQNDAELDEEYITMAPDILFLDIHLTSAKGNELLKSLKKKIDPYAYVVIISSDTQKDLIIDIKKGGAKGFLVKPLDRNSVYAHLMKSPTTIV